MNSAALTGARGYIRRETAVSMAINAVLSLLFFLAFFHGQDPVKAWGMGQWVFDFVPQSFMIALMSALVPGIQTMKRIRDGALRPIDNRSFLPRGLLPRALTLAVAAAILGGGLVGLAVVVTGIRELPATAALGLKVAYGAVLAMIVTPPALRAAMAPQKH